MWSYPTLTHLNSFYIIATGNRRNRWSMVTIRLALAVYTRSPAAYDALKSFGLVQLLSRATLQAYTGAFRDDAGECNSHQWKSSTQGQEGNTPQGFIQDFVLGGQCVKVTPPWKNIYILETSEIAFQAYLDRKLVQGPAPLLKYWEKLIYIAN